MQESKLPEITMPINGSVKIGMVNFINTTPLYETWKETVIKPDWQVIEANPVELNNMLSSGDLDLGFISSQEYASSPDKYRILNDLSISANGPVGSVYLFSEVDLINLNEKTVFLSPQSQTSNCLVKILLEKFVKIKPSYSFSENLHDPDSEEKAVVAIGDRALRIKASDRYPFIFDLSEMWKKHTGLPFVFAVWAVREEFYLQHPGTVSAVHKELLRCVKVGKKNLMDICKVAAPRIPIPVQTCFEYLQGIEYDLGQDKINALELFYNFLIELGEGQESALPLRFI